LEADHTASALVRPTAAGFSIAADQHVLITVFSMPGIQSVNYGANAKTVTDLTVWLPGYVKLIADYYTTLTPYSLYTECKEWEVSQ